MWHYLGRVVYPISPSISDSWTVTAIMGWSDWASLLAMLVLLGVTVFLFYRHRQYSIGLVWFAIWMLPASGLVPLRHLRAERYLYPASWGLCFLFVLLILSCGSSRYRSLLLGSIVLFLMGVSAWECRHWFSDRVLFEHSVQQDPAHLEGRLGIVNNHLNRGLERGQIAKANGGWQFNQADARSALEQVQSVLEQSSNPELRAYWPAFETYTYQGLAHFYLGDLENAKTAFETANTYRPNSGVGKYHLGLIALSRSEYPRAIDLFQSALRVQPHDFLTRSNLAFGFLRNNQLDDATGLLAELVDERPDNQLNRLNYGNCLLAKKQCQRAKPHFAWLVEQDAGNTMVQSKMAWCEYMTGDKINPFIRLEKALRRNPNEPTALSILSHLRDKERELNRRANQ
jgi:tetratricopeptide (TPR) repeat protein